MKKILSVLLALLTALLLVACAGEKPSGGTNDAVPEEADTAEAVADEAVSDEAAADETEAVAEDAVTDEAIEGTDEDGQNPVMNFIGPYEAGRAHMLVEAEGMENAKITVTWAGSAWENAEWIMSGTLDLDTLSVEYSDCVKTERVYNDDGEVASENVVYENGAGRVIFRDNGEVIWEDDTEHIADELVFSFGPVVIPEAED